MNILHISYSDAEGGADKAALRICKAQRKAGINAQMLVAKKITNYSFVRALSPGWRQLEFLVKNKIAQKLVRMQKTSNPIHHSLNIFPSFVHHIINKSDADVVNLHWVGKEMISIREISLIKKPIVWTLHDSWAFCGAEHHPNGLEDMDFTSGYTQTAKWSWNQWNWNRKQKFWKDKNFHIVTPSRWQGAQAKKSRLMGHLNIHTIPNPLPIDIFKPINKQQARQKLNLPLDKKIILFGALRSMEDRNKGYDLLLDGLTYVRNTYEGNDLMAVIFGMSEAEDTLNIDFPRMYVGKINEEAKMALLYAAADVMVVPSRMENLPQTATEPIACGTPVVAFNIGGIPDIIKHQTNGYLAQPYKAEDLGNGILWILNHANPSYLSESCRSIALAKFSEQAAAMYYDKLYHSLLNPQDDTFPTQDHSSYMMDWYTYLTNQPVAQKVKAPVESIFAPSEV